MLEVKLEESRFPITVLILRTFLNPGFFAAIFKSNNVCHVVGSIVRLA